MDPKSRIRSVCMNGTQVPLSEATVSVMAPGLTFAALVFEGVRGYWNAAAEEMFLFRLDDHLERLRFSMQMLQLSDPPTADTLRSAALETVRANQFREDCYLRIQAYVDDWGDMAATAPVAWNVIARPRPRTAAFQEGGRFCVSSWRRLSDNASPPRMKAAANYLNSRLARLEAKESGFESAIILTERGTVSEGPGGCIFMVRNGLLVTPSVTSGILESITRDTLLILARESGIPATERDIDRTELYAASEAFYCGTGQEMTPILTIDRFQMGDGRPGPITRQLQQTYDAVVRGSTTAHVEWRFPVYADW